MPPLILLFYFLFVTTTSGAQVQYLYCGALIDGKSNSLMKEMTIIVDDNKIREVVKGYAPPLENMAIEIDLKDKVVLPGLMDMHVHIESQSSKKRYEEGFRMNEADVALRATSYCKKTLQAGFTTVRDMGGTGVNVSLQKAIAIGYVEGPRIFTAEKAIATTGGHADPTNGLRKDLMNDPGPKEGVINSPEDAKKAVRQRYKNGADCIKITATGGVLSVAKDGQGPQFTMEELEAIVSTAKDYGMHTAAHAHGAAGMKRAVLAGITSIEHGTFMTDEIMDLMLEKGTYLVSTISAGKFTEENAKIPGFYPDVIIPKIREVSPKIQATFGKAYQKGVKIAFGTDSGVSPHGDNAKEFIFMTEAGMPAMEAIQAATMTAATLLGKADELGSIEAGKLADIIAVEEDPTQNIETILNVRFVMKDGVVYKNK